MPGGLAMYKVKAYFVVNPNQSAIRDFCYYQSHRESIRGIHQGTDNLKESPQVGF